MIEMRVTSKGQVTIPKPVRDRLGIVAGSEVVFEEGEDGRVYLARLENFDEHLAMVRAVAGTMDPGMTTAEIMRMTRGDDWVEESPSRPARLDKLEAVLRAHEKTRR